MMEYDWNTSPESPSNKRLGLVSHIFLRVPSGLLYVSFYAKPIVLELEADNDFVGVRICIDSDNLAAFVITFGFEGFACNSPSCCVFRGNSC